MSWIPPPLFVTGGALTAAQLLLLSGDLNESMTAKASGPGQLFVSTNADTIAARLPVFGAITTGNAEITTSTSFADLNESGGGEGTLGPIVTATTGTAALVFVSAEMSCTVAGGFCQAGYGISGATEREADLHRATSWRSQQANYGGEGMVAVYETELTPGKNIFTEKYCQSNGVGTAKFQYRRLSIIPL